MKLIGNIIVFAGLVNIFTMGLIKIMEDYMFMHVSDLWWIIMVFIVAFFTFGLIDMLKFSINKRIESGKKFQETGNRLFFYGGEKMNWKYNLFVMFLTIFISTAIDYQMQWGWLPSFLVFVLIYTAISVLGIQLGLKKDR